MFDQHGRPLNASTSPSNSIPSTQDRPKSLSLVRRTSIDILADPPSADSRLLSSIGQEFPVVDEEESSGPDDSETAHQEVQASLASMAKRGWKIDKDGGSAESSPAGERDSVGLPPIHLPDEDERLRKEWTSSNLKKILKEQRLYFAHGLYGSKRDVAPGLDPIQLGMITETRAEELIVAYWNSVHPQMAMLNPKLHNMGFLRSRSALLTTTLLAIGACAIATSSQSNEELVQEALKLHAHVEKLMMIVFTTSARSIEIMQAHILLSRWGISPRTRQAEQRWMRASVIPRMAAEIGFDLPRRIPGRDQDGQAGLLRWNNLATRVSMIVNEYRFYLYSGRRPINMSEFELDEDEVNEITRIGAQNQASSVPALYHLYLFGRDVNKKVSSIHSKVALDAELEWVDSYTRRWIAEWCSEMDDARRRWCLQHEALCQQLQLSARILRKRGDSDNAPLHRQRLLDIATRIFVGAVDSHSSVHMTNRASIFPFAAAIVLRFSSRTDLVLRLALRMAGDPRKTQVPTFIREAGNQMLAMLCVNSNCADTSTQAPESDIGFSIPVPLPAVPALSPSFPNPGIFQSLDQITQPDDPGCLFSFDGAFDFPYISESNPAAPQGATFDDAGSDNFQPSLPSWLTNFNSPNMTSPVAWNPNPIPQATTGAIGLHPMPAMAFNLNDEMLNAFSGFQVAQTPNGIGGSLGPGGVGSGGVGPDTGQSGVAGSGMVDWEGFQFSPASMASFGAATQSTESSRPPGIAGGANRQVIYDAINHLLQVASTMQH